MKKIYYVAFSSLVIMQNFAYSQSLQLEREQDLKRNSIEQQRQLDAAELQRRKNASILANALIMNCGGWRLQLYNGLVYEGPAATKNNVGRQWLSYKVNGSTVIIGLETGTWAEYNQATKKLYKRNSEGRVIDYDCQIIQSNKSKL